jgi:hypothetical protein
MASRERQRPERYQVADCNGVRSGDRGMASRPGFALSLKDRNYSLLSVGVSLC